MTESPWVPCQSNNDISLDALNKSIQDLVDERQRVLDRDPKADVLQLDQRIAAVRRQYHPDHWFHDPGSGRETEEGRQRRRAKQACWSECPMRERLRCLDKGMQPGPTLNFGIYGGYDEAERQAISAELERRRARGK
jgi:hypothetical protein